jgi:hypothetical protein
MMLARAGLLVADRAQVLDMNTPGAVWYGSRGPQHLFRNGYDRRGLACRPILQPITKL